MAAILENTIQFSLVAKKKDIAICLFPIASQFSAFSKVWLSSV